MKFVLFFFLIILNFVFCDELKFVYSIVRGGRVDDDNYQVRPCHLKTMENLGAMLRKLYFDKYKFLPENNSDSMNILIKSIGQAHYI